MKVLVLYDFVGEPGSSELSVTAGETLIVSRRDVGEGWWEGTNSSGRTGLFPAAYVEEINTTDIAEGGGKPPPALPPPPLPVVADPWDEQQNEYYSQVPGQQYQQQQPPYPYQQQSPDDFYDDEWDDDSECGGSTVTSSVAPPTPMYPAMTGIMRSSSATKTSGKAGMTTSGPSGSGSKFSTKSDAAGAAAYITGIVQQPIAIISEGEQISILVHSSGPGGPMAADVEWCRDPNDDVYRCVVASPKKESKLKGLKSFIAYQLTPTFNNIQVSRRYKHFDWLHERLLDKYCLIPIPPLPDKQISGRYEEHFIERRKQQLQAFVDAVCRHPVLSRGWVWRQHFITCTEEKRWKIGKRRAESRNASAETLTGANLFFAIRVIPADNSADQQPSSINQALLDREIDGFQKFVSGVDSALKTFAQTVAEQSKRVQTCYKRDAQRLGQSFYALGQAYSKDDYPTGPSGNNAISRTKITAALKKTGDAFNEMGGRFMDDELAAGWDTFADMLHVYRGVTSAFPDILTVHKSAVQKRKECERQYADGIPIGSGEGGASGVGSGPAAAAAADPEQQRRLLREVQRRTDLVSYSLLAEINHFHRDQVIGQMAGHARRLLRTQINFYRKVADNLESVLNLYPEDSDDIRETDSYQHYQQQQQQHQGGISQHQYYANQ